MTKRTFARTIPDNLRAPQMNMWGFEAQRARKFARTLPRTLPWNFITMLSTPLILNDGFQSGMFRGWSRSARAEGTKYLKRPVFSGILHSLPQRRGLPPSQVAMRNLKNTVRNPQVTPGQPTGRFPPLPRMVTGQNDLCSDALTKWVA